jgi:uncharacterized membrane protein YphA (DoxX/SURF4 family)
MWQGRCVKAGTSPQPKELSVFTALSLVLAVVCLVPAVGKLGAHPKMLATAGHFDIPWAQYRLIGVAELVAAVGVLLGLVWSPVGVVAASGMCALLVGALASHRRVGDPLPEAAPALVALAVDLAYLAVALGR